MNIIQITPDYRSFRQQKIETKKIAPAHDQKKNEKEQVEEDKKKRRNLFMNIFGNKYISRPLHLLAKFVHFFIRRFIIWQQMCRNCFYLSTVANVHPYYLIKTLLLLFFIANDTFSFAGRNETGKKSRI